jgi:hypothetical protein
MSRIIYMDVFNSFIYDLSLVLISVYNNVLHQFFNFQHINYLKIIYEMEIGTL